MTSNAKAQETLDYINQSPTPFHAVANGEAQLDAAGFSKISERDAWKLTAGGKYYFTRNKTTLVAFTVGGKAGVGSGFSIVGAHTDSPCLRVKPVSKSTKEGYLNVGVECYGGGLWNTWFDRDLSVAGRVIVRTGENAFAQRLVKVTKPLARISNLAIHLNREIRQTGFKFNYETHTVPMIATALKGQLEGEAPALGAKHHPVLVHAVADALGVDADSVEDFELCLYDTQDGVIGGAKDEFIFSARQDNLCMSYISLSALVDASDADTLAASHAINMAVLFDHEEIGSKSAQGAGSSLMERTVRRVAEALGAASEDDMERMFRASFLVSADAAHAVHPNYGEKHEAQHKPAMHAGPVLKFNTNQRYATTSVTAHIVRQLAVRAGVPLQEFVVRNDSACGSTIGPMLSASTGIRTVDLGNPMLSMHSVREMCGTDDCEYAHKLFVQFYKDFAAVDTLQVD